MTSRLMCLRTSWCPILNRDLSSAQLTEARAQRPGLVGVAKLLLIFSSLKARPRPSIKLNINKHEMLGSARTCDINDLLSCLQIRGWALVISNLLRFFLLWINSSLRVA